MDTPLRAPFPWFGGKSRASSLIWERFGNTPNYVEPFAGSLAVLLGRPHAPGTETVNDKDAYLANFWRAIQSDPAAVAHHAEWPVSEADLTARHLWLVRQRDDLTRNLQGDPAFYDVLVAGWWVWGLSSWIGSGWCSGEGPWVSMEGRLQDARQLPHLSGAQGVNRKLPHLAGGKGVNRKLEAWFGELAERLRDVRVVCGDWSRVLGPSVTHGNGLTAVILDPPYDDGEMEYAAGGQGISSEVRAWAIANGDNPMLRIALCGYEGEHPMPATWETVEWKATGGYGNQRKEGENVNAKRERIWFSPACINPSKQAPGLFDGLGGVA